ncbi:aquaporin rerated protein, invertebrate [Mytilus galloprovincialis]|uniref:Aquaporin rerated protein, invertebrate n=2 Tax=Mytilus galloprovincialis TaxID=29158 RepID=A0A8B6CLC3_MYTGA|nr:aquaporin rerated protein, invertebrate [Mytilus galloprovincialis]
MSWRELWTVLIGLDPPLQYFPPAVASIILFIIIFSFCFCMYRLSESFPPTIKMLTQDFFKTLAFCTYPFGLMILRKYHGDIGYALCSIPLNTATVLILSSGEGSPVGNWLLFVKGSQSLQQCTIRIITQIGAGITAFRIGKTLMKLDLHPSFEENLSQTECIAALNVAVTTGFIIELFGTTWDVWFHSQNFSDNLVLDKLLKFCNSSFTFCLGGYPTGMFRDPAKAIGLTFGCKGISPSQHILVYFLAPLIGSYLAYRFMLHSTATKGNTFKPGKNFIDKKGDKKKKYGADSIKKTE